MKFKNIVKSSPDFIYRTLKSVYDKIPMHYKHSRRYKTIYNDTYRFLIKSQWWSKEQHEEYQFQELKKLIKHAYETVPYYRRIFNQYGVDVKKIKNFDNLKSIPYLTKEIIQQYADELISTEYNKDKLSYVTTGGSTGIPMGFYRDSEYELARENAFIDLLYNRIDYKKGDKTFVLRGNMPAYVNRKKNIFVKKKSSTEMYASSYHLNQKNIEFYVNALHEFNPECIRAYPSSLYLVARYIKENDVECFTNIKSVILASENVYNYQRELFKEIFTNARIYSFYGHTEHACLAGECKTNAHYHLQSEYGYTELIGENGLDVTQDGEIGEIVATSFNNYAMPLIRYKTSDLAINSTQKCSCGRNYKLIKGIQGRTQEQIITKDDTKIALTSIIHSQHMDALGRVREYQLVQNVKGEMVIRIVKSPKFKSSDAEQIINKMESAADHNLKVNIEFVNHIDKSIRGKHKFFIQNIKD